MNVVRLALALEKRTEGRLLAEFLDSGYEVVERVATAADLVERLGERLGGRRVERSGGAIPDVVLVTASRRQLSAQLISECDRRGIRIIAFAGSDLERRHAASLGLYEVLDQDAPWGEIDELLTAGVPIPARAGQRSRLAATSGEGATIAVWGPAGAPGRTTLAINVAAEIAAAGYEVALVDVDTHSGSVAPALGLLDEAPGFAAACRLAGTDSLTVTELERIAQSYQSRRAGFWVLTGLSRPTRWPELSDDRVTKALRVIREWVDYVVIDTGFSLETDEEVSSDLFAPRRNAATVAAVREADHVVAVGCADPVGMSRFLRAHADLLETMEGKTVSVVLNKVRSSALGPSPFAQVAATLNRFSSIDNPVLVPFDQHAVDGAMLQGLTLADSAPKSAARIVVRRFVESVMLPSPEPETRSAPVRRRARKTVV